MFRRPGRSILLPLAALTAAAGIAVAQRAEEPANAGGGATVGALSEASGATVREVHIVRIEIVRPADGKGYGVLVDGDPLDASSAAMVLELLDRTRGAAVVAAPVPSRAGTNATEPNEVSNDAGAEESVDFDAPLWPTTTPEVTLTPSRIAAFLAVLEDFEPSLHRAMTEVQAIDHDRFVRLVEEKFPQWMELVNLRESDSEAYELRRSEYALTRALFDLRRQYRIAQEAENASEMDRLRTEAADLIGRQLDVRRNIRERELQELETQLKRLRLRLDAQQNDRDRTVQKRLDDLLS